MSEDDKKATSPQRTRELLDIIHSDVYGRKQVESNEKAIYSMEFTDDLKMVWVMFHQITSNTREFIQFLQDSETEKWKVFNPIIEEGMQIRKYI